LLAAFGIVLELLVVKEKLFPGCENELVPAIHALQNPVYEVHPVSLAPPQLAW
jgi:hypothetical protein